MIKTYPKRIYVWCKGSPKTAPDLKWFFVWCTNAYPTCKAAVEAAKASHPDREFKAAFKW